MYQVDDFKKIEEAKESLPLEYRKIDEQFLSEYKDQIETLKEVFSDKGGVYKINVGEYDLLCRLPQIDHIKQVNSNKNRDAFDVDRELLSYCLLYPKIDIVNSWVKQGSIGVVASAVKKLMELGLVYQEAQAKKL